MVISCMTKTTRRHPSLVMPAGLRLQGFNDDQIQEVERFKQSSQQTARNEVVGFSPIYVEADTEMTDTELAAHMHPQTGELSRSERNQVLTILFETRDKIARWSHDLGT